MTKEEAIARLLLDHATGLETILPVAYPDVPFDDPDDGAHLRLALFFNGAAYEGLGSGDIKQGQLLVSVIMPKGQGLPRSAGIAGAVGTHFHKGLSLFGHGLRVRVSAEPQIAAPVLSDAETLTPITIPWRA